MGGAKNFNKKKFRIFFSKIKKKLSPAHFRVGTHTIVHDTVWSIYVPIFMLIEGIFHPEPRGGVKFIPPRYTKAQK